MEYLQTYVSSDEEQQKVQRNEIFHQYAVPQVNSRFGYQSKRRRLLQNEDSHRPKAKIDLKPGLSLEKSFYLPISKPGKVPRHLRTSLIEHTSAVTRVRWSWKYDQMLASTSMDHKVHLWDVFNSELPVFTISSHSSGVKDVRWTSDKYVIKNSWMF